MMKLRKKLAIAGVCVALAAGTITGCGSSNAGKAIAVLDGENVDYALVNLMVRYNQAQMQSMYGSLFGDAMWESYGATTRDGVMDSVQQMLILEKHMDEYGVSISEEDKAEITAAAKNFMESNDKEVLEAMTASQEIVEQMLTLQLVQTRMRAEMIKDVDTEVSDEEAAQKTIQYVLFSTAGTTGEDGKEVALTEEEKAALKDQAEQVLTAVKDGEAMDVAAKAVDENKTASTISYGEGDETLAAEVKEAVDKLEDGQLADSVIETENGYYVAMMQSTFDKEATENKKSTIVSERQTAKFDEIYEAWKTEAEFSKDETLLAKIDFVDVFQVKQTETEAATESGSEVQTEAVTESGSEAQTEAATEGGSETQTETETDSES